LYCHFNFNHVRLSLDIKRLLTYLLTYFPARQCISRWSPLSLFRQIRLGEGTLITIREEGNGKPPRLHFPRHDIVMPILCSRLTRPWSWAVSLMAMYQTLTLWVLDQWQHSHHRAVCYGEHRHSDGSQRPAIISRIPEEEEVHQHTAHIMQDWLQTSLPTINSLHFRRT